MSSGQGVRRGGEVGRKRLRVSKGNMRNPYGDGNVLYLDRTDVNILVGILFYNSVRWYYWDKLWLLHYLLQPHVNQQLSKNKKFNKERRKKKKKSPVFGEAHCRYRKTHTHHLSYDGEALGLEPVRKHLSPLTCFILIAEW